MIENKVYSINVDELDKVRQEANTSVGHLAEIHGQEIQSWDEYLDKIEVAFQFPSKWRVNLHGYVDWMKDLDWLGKESYILIIHDYSSFLLQDLECKELVMEIFNDEILPWWQKDVALYVAGWKPKRFNIYLVVGELAILDAVGRRQRQLA